MVRPAFVHLRIYSICALTSTFAAQPFEFVRCTTFRNLVVLLVYHYLNRSFVRALEIIWDWCFCSFRLDTSETAHFSWGAILGDSLRKMSNCEKRSRRKPRLCFSAVGLNRNLLVSCKLGLLGLLFHSAFLHSFVGPTQGCGVPVERQLFPSGFQTPTHR